MLADFLAGAERRIVPSQDVADRLGRYLPYLAFEVWPHPESSPAPLPRVARVVTLGSLSPEKGLAVVADCARDAKRRQLPLVFRVLGPTTAPLPRAPEVPLSIAGAYDEGDLARLLAAERADALFFPAQVPETWSYTLSVALASGLPIVASDLGAFAERLAGHPRAQLLAWNSSASAWNDALVSPRAQATPRPSPRRPPAPWRPPSIAAAYLAVLPADAPLGAPLPALDARHFTAPERDERPPLSLPALYAAGVLCGQAEARREFERRVEVAERDLQREVVLREREVVLRERERNDMQRELRA